MLKMCVAQNKSSFYYTLKDGKQLSIPEFAFQITNKKDGYIFLFRADTSFIEYQNGNKDTIISQPNYGPYRFKRRNQRVFISYKNEEKWEENEYFILKKDTSYLIPDIFSTTLDTYNISCSLLDENSRIELNGKKISSFKFSEVQKSNHGTPSYKIVYVDKHTLLPLRIEYYQDKEYKILSSVVINM